MPSDDGPAGRKVAGVLMLASAAFTLLRPMLLQIWLPEIKPDASTLGTVALELLLGVALLQGSEGARKFTIGVLIVGSLALLGLTPLVLARGVTAWLVVLGFGLLGGAGALALLIGETPSARRVRAGVILVVVSWVGTFGSEIWLLRLPDILLWDQLAAKAFPERIVDEASRHHDRAPRVLVSGAPRP